jgi:hypothetical protein
MDTRAQDRARAVEETLRQLGITPSSRHIELLGELYDEGFASGEDREWSHPR